MNIRIFLFLFLSNLNVNHSLGQRFGDYYISFSIDGTQGGGLKFVSDTTVELSSIHRHMMPSLRTVYKYIKDDTTIQIFTKPVFRQDSSQQGLYIPYRPRESKIILTIIEEGFIDNSKFLIYVKRDNNMDNRDMAYVIDGKMYIQDCGKTNGYGIVRKAPKRNKALQKRINEIETDSCSIEILRGLNAYNRFGIKWVYGVIVIATKK